jgi:hypothetical protein
VRVGANGIYLHAQALELVVLLCQVNQFGGAYEGEVGRIEEEYCPFALYIVAGYCGEAAIVESLYVELGEKRIDNRCHNRFLIFSC